MSYPFYGLDEISDEALYAELVRRAKSRREGKCDYCNREAGIEPACRFPDRHKRSPLAIPFVSSMRLEDNV